jgi:hypothetical protein
MQLITRCVRVSGWNGGNDVCSTPCNTLLARNTTRPIQIETLIPSTVNTSSACVSTTFNMQSASSSIDSNTATSNVDRGINNAVYDAVLVKSMLVGDARYVPWCEGSATTASQSSTNSHSRSRTWNARQQMLLCAMQHRHTTLLW